MEHREVVVRSSMLILRAWADLDRMYMDGGVTAGGSGDTDSRFSLGASLLSAVNTLLNHIQCKEHQREKMPPERSESQCLRYHPQSPPHPYTSCLSLPMPSI